MSPRIVCWDRRTYRPTHVSYSIPLRLSAEVYEAKLRDHLTIPDVRDRLDDVLSFDRNDLLTRIEAEFREAAKAGPPPAVTKPAADVEQPRSGCEEPEWPTRTTPEYIESLGDRCYRVGELSESLTENEDLVLQAFLRVTGGALTKKRLADVSGLDESGAVRVLRELRGYDKKPPKYDGLFRPFIKMPGARGHGGYRVRIRSC
jgi:hypothetical protein